MGSYYGWGRGYGSSWACSGGWGQHGWERRWRPYVVCKLCDSKGDTPSWVFADRIRAVPVCKQCQTPWPAKQASGASGVEGVSGALLATIKAKAPEQFKEIQEGVAAACGAAGAKQIKELAKAAEAKKPGEDVAEDPVRLSRAHADAAGRRATAEKQLTQHQDQLEALLGKVKKQKEQVLLAMERRDKAAEDEKAYAAMEAGKPPEQQGKHAGGAKPRVVPVELGPLLEALGPSWRAPRTQAWRPSGRTLGMRGNTPEPEWPLRSSHAR